jgi:ubiquinone/menaquinone biosynthesis C-methylase UbiE
MSDYLDFSADFSDPELVSAYDQVSIWSAMFGLMMLDRIPMRRNMLVLDIGYGTGFPILELALRLGDTCKVYGVDPWDAARQRAELKARLWQVRNVDLLPGDAAAMPFPDAYFDLLVSNLGVNNFADPLSALKECARVAKPGARLALTSNLQGHMQEFYDIYEATLRQVGRENCLPRLQSHIAHRGTLESLSDLLERSGFRVATVHQESAVLRFLDGSTLLRHAFIKMGFLDAWVSVLKPASREEKVEIFTILEKNLNDYARSRGELSLTIPMVYMEGERII